MMRLQLRRCRSHDSENTFVVGFESEESLAQSSDVLSENNIEARMFFRRFCGRALAYQQRCTASGAALAGDTRRQKEARLKALRQLVMETSFLDDLNDETLPSNEIRPALERTFKSTYGHTSAHHRMRNHVVRVSRLLQCAL